MPGTPLVSFYPSARTRTQTFHGSINLLPSVPETLRKIHWENARRCTGEGREIICRPGPASYTHTHISTHTRRGHLHTHTHKHGEEIKLQLCASTASYNFAADFFFTSFLFPVTIIPSPLFLQFLFGAISGFFRLPCSATPPDYVFWPTLKGVDAKLCCYFSPYCQSTPPVAFACARWLYGSVRGSF